MPMSSPFHVLLVLGAGAVGLVATSAQAQRANALLAHGGAWGAVTVGATSHEFRCGSCEHFSSASAGGTSVTVGAGMRMRRLVGGGMHRQWQGWFDEYPSHGKTSALMLGLVLADNDVVVLMPYVGIGRESFRHDISGAGETVHGASPVLLGGGEIVMLPRRRVSPVIGFDRQGWLRWGHRGSLGRGHATGATSSVGLTIH
jgi:hypothetical protein